MSLNVTCAQAYKIVYHFLDIIYFTTYDDNLGSILSGAALYFDISDAEPETMDPAIFGEWINCIKMVMNDDTITYKSQITIEQMQISAYQYFVTYCNKGAEPSIEKLRDLLGEDFNKSDITRWLKTKWLQSIEYILQKVSTDEIGHLFGNTTKLTPHESFFIMQIFLDNFCKRNNNFDLIQLIKNSRLHNKSDIYNNIPEIIEPEIWNVWQNAIKIILEQEEDKALNLLSAYKAIPIFLANYFKKNRSNFIDKVIQKFEIGEDNKPVNFAYWSSWTSSAVKLNAKQTEIINNLVSINSSISQNIAFKIIQAWFKQYETLLNSDIMHLLLTDTALWQQAIDTIKQAPRSYLLLDNEVTILETYQIMIKFLASAHQNIEKFEIDPEQQNKPKNFAILLDWIRICEQVIKN